MNIDPLHTLQCGLLHHLRQTFHFFHLILLSTRFPAAGLSTTRVRPDWLHDWNSAAKWAQLLIAYPVAALSNMQKVLSTMRAELA